ncbi:MAG: Uma2 family endonuclease [Clostridia bacterium]|nr:Uma2 family endonuclease [Deltaproteobacteria bacterium]
MTSIVKHCATYDDIRRLPPNLTGELIAGDLLVSPRPAGPHAHAASLLGMDIGTPFQRGRGGPGGWRILYEPELHLHNDVLVPDLAGWKLERLPAIPDDHRFVVSPDWVCEVLSPSTARFDRVAKMRAYARAAVPHVWFVSPLDRTLEVFRLNDRVWILLRNFGADEGDDVVRAEPFDAVELQLSALWSPELATAVARDPF